MAAVPHEPVGCSGSDPHRQPPGTLREVFGRQRAAEPEQHHGVDQRSQFARTRAGSGPASQTKTRRRASAGGQFTSAVDADGKSPPYRPSRRATTTAALPWCEDSAHHRRNDPERGLASDSDGGQPSPQPSPRPATSRCDALSACSCLTYIMGNDPMLHKCICNAEHSVSAGGARQPAWWPRRAGCSAP